MRLRTDSGQADSTGLWVRPGRVDWGLDVPHVPMTKGVSLPQFPVYSTGGPGLTYVYGISRTSVLRVEMFRTFLGSMT